MTAKSAGECERTCSSCNGAPDCACRCHPRNRKRRPEPAATVMARDCWRRKVHDGACPPTPDSSDDAKPAYYSKEHFVAALTWIENNTPGGIRLVARALSETSR